MIGAPSSSSRRVIRFGVFQVDLDSGELFKSGIKVRITDQPFQVLIMLLERPGEVVTREQLRERLWPDGTFVDFEHSLNAAVKKLRDALSDSADNPRFVETLARRGYRFIAPVEWSNAAAAAELPAPARPRRLHWPVWVAGAVLIAAGVSLRMWRHWREPAASPAAPLKVVPFTSYTGEELSPSFSPDGNQIAFAWNGEKQDNYDIYVKLVGPGTPFRLTTHPARDDSPAWSPDGRHIAFLRETGSGSEILLIPALGGQPERRLGKTALVLGQSGGLLFPKRLSWSPDGRFLAFSDSTGVFLLSVDSRERRKLTSGEAPSFSPDGRSIAFVRGARGGLGDVFLQPLSAGGEPAEQPKQLTHYGALVLDLDWMPDGRHILASLAGIGLRRIPLDGGTAESLEVSDQPVLSLAVSRRGNRLAFARYLADPNIYALRLAHGEKTEPPRRLISSTRADFEAQFSPDGNRIVFSSDRSGILESWVCAGDGTNCFQLTSIGGAGSPRWSPDGRQVAFDSGKDGSWDIYVTDLDGGSPRRIAGGPSNQARPTWSRDGKWIYFGDDRGATYQVWKTPVDGGDPVQVTKNGGFEAFESADGKLVYYVKRGSQGIWRVPVAGGEEGLVVDIGDEGRWALTEHGIYLIATGRSGPELRFFDLAARRLSTVAALPKEAVGLSGDPALSVSPDGKTILYTQIDHAAHDIMLVENFPKRE